jgi:single-strand DNA-binding protein
MEFVLRVEGNLAEDAELRITDSGRSVCRLRVAHNRRRRDNDGEWQNAPALWVDVTAWGELAERCAHLRKGDTVIVTGRDDLRAWPFVRQEDQTPDARLQVTAANVALSLRFRSAQVTPSEPGGFAEDPAAELEPSF